MRCLRKEPLVLIISILFLSLHFTVTACLPAFVSLCGHSICASFSTWASYTSNKNERNVGHITSEALKGRTVVWLKQNTSDLLSHKLYRSNGNVGGVTILLLLLHACSLLPLYSCIHSYGFRELNTRKRKRSCLVSIQPLRCTVCHFLCIQSPLCVFRLICFV